MSAETFLEVFGDVRFPLIAIDVRKLQRALEEARRTGESVTHVGIRLEGPPERRAALVSALRGILRTVDLPPSLVVFLAGLDPIVRSGYSKDVTQLRGRRAQFSVSETNGILLWEEESPWPVAYSTILQQLTNILSLHRHLIEKQIAETGARLTAAGFAPENVQLLSEYPRQLPTHLHYAMASLGAWLGGAINVQYFAYYASIRQIVHPSLNLKYADRIGFEAPEAQALDASGIVVLPASLVAPLLEAQGSTTVLGSIPIDEVNVINQPAPSYFETQNGEHEERRPGVLVDKFYRMPFWARKIAPYGFYGIADVLRDHYEAFYEQVRFADVVRCKHYCVPIVDVSSPDELRRHVALIPRHHDRGVVFRGQAKLYTLDRNQQVKEMLFGPSCSIEPSLVTAASRETAYDYDHVHFALKRFLEDDVLHRNGRLMDQWIEASVLPDCRLDLAILALAQHYGLPSHGLDVTRSLDVALWFATNIYSLDKQRGVATYTAKKNEDWKNDRIDWPVVIACQTVTHSIMQSLHDCEELAAFGFDARRPVVQEALFFQGGHSDHQNRLAEAVVCVFRLAPGQYATESSFVSLFPTPEEDPAYRVMLNFAGSAVGRSFGRFVNRFHG